MPEAKEIYEVVHSSPEITTVLAYIKDVDSPAIQYKDDPESFLLVLNNNGISNREAIEVTYNAVELELYRGLPADELLLKVGTVLAIEKEKVNRAGLLTQGLEVISNDEISFKARMLAELESKEGYVPISRKYPIQGKKISGALIEYFPEVTVWIWCRSLATASNNFEGEIFNLTPFVESVTTNVAKTGGNFNLTLPPIVCERSESGQWIIKKKSVEFYSKSSDKNSLQKVGYVSDANLFENSIQQPFSNQTLDNSLVRSQMLFHNLISSNDLVFIRFETLQLEEDLDFNRDIIIPKSAIPNRVYDMIGLIDQNDQTSNFDSLDVSITIDGRDLSKLLIEDGTYFYSLELSQGMFGGIGSASNQVGLTQRLAVDGSQQYLSLYFNNSVEKVIKFVINQLSNIKVVPDNLFSPYGDRRNTRYVERKDDERFSKIEKEKEELKRQVLSVIKDVRISNQINNSNVDTENAEVLFLHTELKKFLKAIRENKVRKIQGNSTIGWTSFNYTNERGVDERIEEDVLPSLFSDKIFNVQETRNVAPEGGSQIVSFIDRELDLDQSKIKYQNELKKEFSPGIWQIIKLVIDKTVANRRLVDSSISSANGSLMNFLTKVCQEPFVEYYMDTYGDMYHIIARKPLIDKRGIVAALKGSVLIEETSSENIQPAIIDIEIEDVKSDKLVYENEVYSWYHFTPQANFQGGSENYSLAYLPAVYFPEYAEIWGSKPMQLVHNYMPMISKDLNANNLDLIQQQAAEDMKFMIESSAYLPFTRRGTITINGDRRIKRGNLIRHKSTGEIFHVDAVKQTFLIQKEIIDRQTVIEVSRGMVESLIEGVVLESGVKVSYFDIVDTTLNLQSKESTSFVEKRVQTGVNKKRVKRNNSNIANQRNRLDIPQNTIVDRSNINLHLLDNLNETARLKFIQLINGANSLGYSVEVTSGRRSFEAQLALFKKNSKLAARPGHSRHESGFAIDINLIKKDTGVRIGLKDSIATWINTKVPQLASSIGLSWGGSFFNNYDPVHFQYVNSETEQYDIVEEPIYETQKVPVKGELDLAKIFSNFKVNKEVFNFFLTRQQFDKSFILKR